MPGPDELEPGEHKNIGCGVLMMPTGNTDARKAFSDRLRESWGLSDKHFLDDGIMRLVYAHLLIEVLEYASLLGRMPHCAAYSPVNIARDITKIVEDYKR